MRLRIVPLSLVLLTACASTTSPGTAPPTGADQLVLRVETAGGFLPRLAKDRTPPEFSMLGDGQVVVPGAQIEIYPSPALPAMSAFVVDDAGKQLIVQAARDAGLDAPSHDEPLPSGVGIADAGTTVFTFVVDGQRRRTSAYALGLSNETGARKKLADFKAKLSDLKSWLPAGSIGEERAYAWTGLRVTLGPEVDSSRDDSVKQTPKDWPLATPLGSWGEARTDGTRCAVATGADAEKLRKPVQESNTLTPWRSEGKTYVLGVRPLLPDETSC